MTESHNAAAGAEDRLVTAERKLTRRLWMSRLWAGLRVLAGSAVVFVLYFCLPFRNIQSGSTWFVLAFLLLVCGGLMLWQIRAIIEAIDPRMRAVEALAVSIPLLLVSFSAVHHVIARSNPASYTEPLTRTDALYFSVTTLSTVGFGDISAVSQGTRIVVIVQMLVNLLVLGVGVRIILGAVEVGRGRAAASTQPPPSDDERTPTHD